MIVNIFRYSQNTSIALILILCVFVWMGVSFNNVEVAGKSSSFLFNFLISPIKSMPLLQRIFLGILIFWQCILMNRMMVQEKIISTNSFYPALFYFLLISISPEIIYINPTIISLLLLILSLTKILSIYLNKNAYTKIFESAFLISLAGLIHPPFLIFIPIVWIGMSIFSQIEWRHWILSVIAIICPWYIMFSISEFYSIEHSSLDSSILFLFTVTTPVPFVNLTTAVASFLLPEIVFIILLWRHLHISFIINL